MHGYDHGQLESTVIFCSKMSQESNIDGDILVGQDRMEPQETKGLSPTDEQVSSVVALGCSPSSNVPPPHPFVPTILGMLFLIHNPRSMEV